MGNSDIRSFAHIEEVPVSDIASFSVSVDASNWLYKYMTTTARFTRSDAYTNDDGVELTNLIGVPRGIRRFFEHNIQPVFVFDGKPHDLKAEEIERRKQKRRGASEKADKSDDNIERSKYQSRSQELNNDVIETTKKLLEILDVPYITAPSAAEAQASYMTVEGDFNAALSDDYDALIFGSELTVRDFTSSSDTVEVMLFDKTLEKHDISHKQLVLATILCGTDYNTGVSGVGPKTAMKIVSDNLSIESLRAKTGKDLDRAESILDLYVNPDVTEEWEDPKISVPDIAEARAYLRSQGIDVSEVDKALDDIKESSSQTGLGAF